MSSEYKRLKQLGVDGRCVRVGIGGEWQAGDGGAR